MHNFRKFAFASLTFFALLFMACDSANGPEESTSPVVGTWTGHYEAKEFGITVKVQMQIDPNHSYKGHASPNVTGMDSVHLYEESGNWTIVGNSFIAAKISCRIVNPDNMVMGDIPCPPNDTAAVAVQGDSVWVGKLRGQPVTLNLKK